MTICVFGSINVDITAYSRRLPRAGETVHGERYLTGLGGKGANQASAASRLGTAVSMIGRLGRDVFAETARAELEAHGVNLGLVEPGEAATGIAIIGVDAAGENCITVIGGANLGMSADDATRAAGALQACRVLLLQNEIPWPANAAAARLARKGGGFVIFDPAPAPQAGLAAEAYELCDCITPNESETEALTGVRPMDAETAKAAARLLRGMGAKSVILKMGAHGLYAENDSGGFFLPAFAVKAIDTVAAGDCFNGGLAHALSQGADFAAACRFAAACGALSTTRLGAAQSAPSLAEVENFLRQNP